MPSSRYKCADVTRNGRVTLEDVAAILLRMGASRGQRQYNAKYDLDDDGKIMVFDVAIAISQLGDRCRQ